MHCCIKAHVWGQILFPCTGRATWTGRDLKALTLTQGRRVLLKQDEGLYCVRFDGEAAPPLHHPFMAGSHARWRARPSHACGVCSIFSGRRSSPCQLTSMCPRMQDVDSSDHLHSARMTLHLHGRCMCLACQGCAPWHPSNHRPVQHAVGSRLVPGIARIHVSRFCMPS